MIMPLMGERISAADFMPNSFRITNLRMHESVRPYWTATVVDGESTVDINNRYGAWHATVGERMYECEAVFGSETGRRVKTTVIEQVEKIRKAMAA